jgi:hypothetical protein
MLLGLLAMALLLVFVFAALVLSAAHRRRMEGAPLVGKPTGRTFPRLPTVRQNFNEPPVRWLAIRSTRPEEVQKALHVANPIPCPLADGLTSAAELEVFVSPPIRGWILVTGSEVPDPADDVDACFLWLRELSRQLGEVQYFVAHRALDHHAWARLLSGDVFRAYAWTGQTAWNQGALTRAELDLFMRCHEYGEVPETDLSDELDHHLSNVEKVPLLAARWSIDPGSIDLARNWSRPGVAGELSAQ